MVLPHQRYYYRTRLLGELLPATAPACKEHDGATGDRNTMRPATLVVTALAVAAAAPLAAAQEGRGNIAAGRRLAEQWCGSCHQLGPAGTPPRADAPGLPQVAQLPSTTALALRVFLRTSHADMPNIQISPADTDDLVAFILSLKEK
jgi:cytochrome c